MDHTYNNWFSVPNRVHNWKDITNLIENKEIKLIKRYEDRYYENKKNNRR
jgi:hypothetical protein